MAGLSAAKAHPGDPAAMAGLANSQGLLDGALGRLMVVAEAYPDLKANQGVANLQEELSSTENKVAFSRQAYNDSVMEYNTQRESFPDNLFAGLFAIFGLCALLLAAVGIYGVIAFSVHQRTQEIGIRMALGAERANVLRLILRQGMLQLLLGLGIGLALAWMAGRLLQSFLVGVRPYDPPTFVGVSLLLAGVALLACWFPAQRASRTSPLVAIRYD